MRFPDQTPVMTSTCHHCGLPLPPGPPITLEPGPLAFCCIGCKTAYRLIHEAGLAEYYQRRNPGLSGLRPETPAEAALRALDDPEFQKLHVRQRDGLHEIHLFLEGIHCAACVWLNERILAGLPGVHQAQVNFATHRALVVWDPTRLKLSELVAAVARIGYRAEPYNPDRNELLHRRRHRDLLLRLAVAGFGAGNVMLIAVALHAGAWQGMTDDLRNFFRWVSLVVATPVVFYSGGIFLRGAFNGLRLGRLTMDLPIALGALVTYGHSAIATLLHGPEVYFDTVTAFLFTLLVGRLLESAARARAAAATERLRSLTPRTATVIRADRETTVPLREVQVGDRVLVRPGETMPVDGEIRSGTTTVDQAMLTGESRPVTLGPGQTVAAGTTNLDGAVELHTLRVGEGTTAAHILRLVEAAQNRRPPIQSLADRMAARFVGTILLLALASALVWLWLDPSRALENSVALLIITCPCALGLATPAAMVTATGAAARLGIIFKDGAVLERLASIGRMALDKTGTLTEGEPQVLALHPAPGVSETELLATAAALERHSEHPLGRAIFRRGRTLLDPQAPPWDQVRNHPGQGLEGQQGNMVVRVGRREFVTEGLQDCPHPPAGDATLVGCRAGGRLLGWFTLGDALRADAPAAVAALRGLGLTVDLLSGDQPSAVAQAAAAVGIDGQRAGLLPADKEAIIGQWQTAGQRVAMVGDGINDAPALARADVAFAVANATGLSTATAHVVLLNRRLGLVPAAVALARRTLAIIHQNFLFSIVYNLVAIPMALTGHVSPLGAAVAMPLSSLAVVLNALRLNRFREEWIPPHGHPLPAAAHCPAVESGGIDRSGLGPAPGAVRRLGGSGPSDSLRG
ncbi:MAG: cadmium-translocating P-type ATPase [Magnetococcales bacterium]|nr:cadmium-translocating P-type ATPase [Magnetococcales bacterium]